MTNEDKFARHFIIKKQPADIENYVASFHGPFQPNFANCEVKQKITDLKPTPFKDRPTSRWKKMNYVEDVKPLKTDPEFTLKENSLQKTFSGESYAAKNSYVLLELGEDSRIECSPVWLYKFTPDAFKLGVENAFDNADGSAAGKSEVAAAAKTSAPKVSVPERKAKILEKLGKPAENSVLAQAAPQVHVSDFSHGLKKQSNSMLDDLMRRSQGGQAEAQAEQTGDYRVGLASDDEGIEDEAEFAAEVAAPAFEGYGEGDDAGAMEPDGGGAEGWGGETVAEEKLAEEASRARESKDRMLALLRGKAKRKAEEAKEDALTDISDASGSDAEGPLKKRAKVEAKVGRRPKLDAKVDAKEMAAERRRVVKAIAANDKVGSLELIRILGLQAGSAEEKKRFIAIVKEVAVMKSEGGRKYFELKKRI